MNWRLGLVVAGLCLAGTSGWAASFSIEPFKVQMVPARGKSSQLFRFANAGTTPQAVQIRIETWMQDASGTEINTPDTESFGVYPNQFVLQPRGTQTVRVTWKQPMPEVEKAFRLVAEQLPVDFPNHGPDAEESEALRYLLVYRAALYVAPAKAKSQVDVVGVARIDVDGQPKLVLDVTNSGKAHTLLKAPKLTLTQADGEVKAVSDGPTIAGLTGQNIMPGMTRRLELPWPEGVSHDVKAVGLDFTAGI